MNQMQKQILLLKKAFLLLSATFVFVACVKDRTINKVEPDPTDNLGAIKAKDIVVNEFVAKGSKNANEFGSNADWIELYNNTNRTIVMEAEKWFITDASTTNQKKYKLPEITLAPGEFIVIWCDGMNTVATQIHTNFNLSAAGEDIGLYYDVDGVLLEVDQKTYGAQTNDGYSLGRQPDGSENWIEFANPTPGSSNN
jgi:hypothetical protein